MLTANERGWVTLHDYVMTDYTLISEPVEVTFKLKKREEVNSSLVKCLKAEAQKITADAEIRCHAINEKIQSLLALPEIIED
jgi:hypothetical protein